MWFSGYEACRERETETLSNTSMTPKDEAMYQPVRRVSLQTSANCRETSVLLRWICIFARGNRYFFYVGADILCPKFSELMEAMKPKDLNNSSLPTSRECVPSLVRARGWSVQIDIEVRQYREKALGLEIEHSTQAYNSRQIRNHRTNTQIHTDRSTIGETRQHRLRMRQRSRLITQSKRMAKGRRRTRSASRE